MSCDQKNEVTITVINLKGGVGKTHTVWSLLGACIDADLSALAIDTDTQSNLTRSLCRSVDLPNITSLFQSDATEFNAALIKESRFTGVDIIPASMDLARLDLTDRDAWEKSDLHLNLHEFLENHRSDYGYVFIDCPPRLSLVSFAALCASDYVIIPLEAADWGAQGVVEVTQAVEYVKRKYNPRLKVLGYLISRFKQRRHYQISYAQKLREHFGDSVFDTVLPDLARFEKSVTHGIPVTIQAPASREAGITRDLFAEVQRRIQQDRASRVSSSRQDVYVAG